MSVGCTKTPKQPLDSDLPRKVYVTSGQLQWCGVATGCINAVIKALEKCGSGKTLDADFFFVDERGSRTDDAEMQVPINEGLKAAGYVYDDPMNAGDD